MSYNKTNYIKTNRNIKIKNNDFKHKKLEYQLSYEKTYLIINIFISFYFLPS